MASAWMTTSEPLSSPCAQCTCYTWGMNLQTRGPTATPTGIPTLNENHNHRKLIKLITALSNSMKLWDMPCRATQDEWVMVESSDKTWSTGEGNGKPTQYSCLEDPMNTMKKQKDTTLKDKLPRLVGAQYATGEEWRNNSRKNEEMKVKAKATSSCVCDQWWK